MQVSDGERITRGEDLEAELARVHAMLALNSKVYKVFIYNCTFILDSFLLLLGTTVDRHCFSI